ncbi:copper resistance protein CopC [Actinoplanes sp. NBC_00393]|uniref:copper resistance CopC family protein n=1 Tax=Actinoplanes sp. NBC_00393 TaxID=2975953 RepID=UPI002E217B5B
MRRLLLALAAVLAVLAPSTSAWAHAQLVASVPTRDATLAEAPSVVTLEFNERLNPDFTTIVVSDAAQQRLPASDVVVDDVRGRVTLTGPPANGTFTVAYRVVSVDGHTVQGSYPYTVADPDLPAASASAVAAAPDADEATGGVPAGVLAGLGATGALLVAVTALLYVSGRRRAAAGS